MAPSSVVRQWFVPGDGIAREVITADIQRYLGPDALVKPGRGTGDQQGVDGYWITAYRTLTSQMLQDLRLDSQRYAAEQQQSGHTRGSPLHGRDGPEVGRPNKGVVAYENSRTHISRQHYGPTTPAPDAYSTDPRAGYAQPPERPQTGGYAQQPNYQPTYSGYPPQAYATQGHYVPSAQSAYPPQQQSQVPRTAYTYAQRDTDSPPTHGYHQPQQQYTYSTYGAGAVPQQPGDPARSPAASNPQYQQYADPRYAAQQPSGRKR